MGVVFLCIKKQYLKIIKKESEKMLERIKRIFYRSMNNKEMDFNEVKQIMLENPNAILLDVRSKQEYEEGHLSGSIPLCLYDICKQADQILPNKEQTIITCCSSGNRSKEAQEMLEKMGYENVYNLKGGLDNIG